MGNLCATEKGSNAADQGVVAGSSGAAISGGPSGSAAPEKDYGGAITGGLSAPAAGAGDAKDAKKLDPKDFQCVKLENAVVIKAPGSIRGQQFIVEDCKNCDIFLLDHCDSVNVDSCTGCRVFIGPCAGSVFIRDCTDCRWVVACQQLRTRDCKHNDILLYIGAGQPVIEASTAMRFGCFQFSYFSLRAQFAAANLSVWNGEWSDVFDFSKRADAKADEPANWSFLPADTTLGSVLRLDVAGLDKEGITDGLSAADRVVPRTIGRAPRPASDHAFVAALSSDSAFELLAKLDAQLKAGDIDLIRTRHSKLTKHNLATLLAADPNALKAAEKTNEVIGLEFGGAKAIEHVIAALTEAGLSGGAAPRAFAPVAAPMEHARLIEAFFEGMRVKV